MIASESTKLNIKNNQMKKTILILISLIFTFKALSITFVVDGISYITTTSNTVAVTSGSYNVSSIVIPANVSYNGNNYTVTSIGKNAFKKSNVTKIKLPPTIVKIGEYAFSEIKYFEEINLPESLISIGDYAFYLNGITSIKIPSSVVSIGNYVFCNSQLSSIELPNSIKKIGFEAFSGCSLSSINLPSSLLEIGSGAFGNCKSLKKIEFPLSVKIIQDGAFSNCTSLDEVTIPSTVEFVGMGTFSNTPWYNNQPDGVVYTGKVAYQYKGFMPPNTTITFPEGTLSISNSCFYFCDNLIKINLPSTLNKIGAYAFGSCSKLNNITIPNNVTTIGDGAFYNCTSLYTISIPSSISDVGGGAFNNTPWYNSLQDGLIYIGKVAYKYKGNMPSNTDIVISGDTKMISSSAFNGFINLKSITIPNSVVKIGASAFSGCTGLNSVTIPESVTDLEFGTFNGCYNLTDVIIPSTLKSIANSVFYTCINLTNVSLSDSLTSIGDMAFYYCSGIEKVKLSSKIKQIGNSAFKSCSGLKTILAYPEYPLEIDESVFNGVNKLSCALYSQPNSVVGYRSTDTWKDFVNQFTLNLSEINNNDDVTKIIYYNKNDKSIVFPDFIDNTEILVFDINGKLIINQTLHGQKHKCNLPNGIYFVKLTSSGQSFSEKIMVN